MSKIVAQLLSEAVANLFACLDNVECGHLLSLLGETENPCVECSIHSLPTKEFLRNLELPSLVLCRFFLACFLLAVIPAL
jgi:hypothetical protein